MATAGSATLSTATSTLYSGTRLKEFAVKNSKDSASNALVHVKGLHDGTDSYPLEPGDAVAFEFSSGISEVTATVASGSATVLFGATKR